MVRASRPGHCRTVPDYGEGLGANPAAVVGEFGATAGRQESRPAGPKPCPSIPVAAARLVAIGIGTDPHHGGFSSADDAIRRVCVRAHPHSCTRRLAHKPDPGKENAYSLTTTKRAQLQKSSCIRPDIEQAKKPRYQINSGVSFYPCGIFRSYFPQVGKPIWRELPTCASERNAWDGTPSSTCRCC